MPNIVIHYDQFNNVKILHTGRFIWYKVNQSTENHYIRYMGSRGSTEPNLTIFNTKPIFNRVKNFTLFTNISHQYF